MKLAGEESKQERIGGFAVGSLVPLTFSNAVRLVGCVVCICTVAVVSDADSKELELENSDFETHEELIIEGWEIITPETLPGEMEIVSKPDVEPHGGKNCLSITTGPEKAASGGFRTIVFNNAEIPVGSGDRVKVTIWAKCSKETMSYRYVEGKKEATLSVILYGYDENNRKVFSLWPLYKRKVPRDWKEFSSVIQLEDKQLKDGTTLKVATVGFAIDVIGNGKLYVDDAGISIVDQVMEE